MEKNQKLKKTAFERIKGLKFFKKSQISFLLKPYVRDHFEKLFGFLKPKQKKEILAEMAEFEATTGEWKFLGEAFKVKRLKNFCFARFRKTKQTTERKVVNQTGTPEPQSLSDTDKERKPRFGECLDYLELLLNLLSQLKTLYTKSNTVYGVLFL